MMRVPGVRLATLALAGGLIAAGSAAGADFGQRGFYGLAGVAHTDASVRLGNNRLSGSDQSWTLGAGYAVTDYVAVELTWQDLGRFDAETGCPPELFCIAVPLKTKADATALGLAVAGRYPLGEKLAVTGTLGLSRWDIDYDGIASAFNDKDTDWAYGVGLAWSPTPKLSVDGRFTRLDLDFDSVGIGAAYRF